MKKKYKIALSTLVVLFLLTFGISISYSLFNKNDNSTLSLVETDEYVSVNYLDGKSFNIEEFKHGDIYSKKVTIANVSPNDTFVTLNLMDISKSSDDILLKVVDSDSNIVFEKKITNVDISVIKGITLTPGKSISYTISVENLGSDTNNFYANVLAYKELIKQSNDSFKDVLLKKNKVSKAKTKVGEEISLGDEGLIKDIDDDGDAYYFRGSVDNNYVDFNGVIFRILRINGDSSIRLILDSKLDNYYSYNDDNSEVENYADKLLYENSSVKEVLEKWVDTNFSTVSKYIVNTSLCEDVNEYKEENGIIYLNTYNRIFTDHSPSLTCMGNKLKERVGLISVDEAEYAGAALNKSNNSFFLYNDEIKSSYWTMSGSQILERYNVVDGIAINKDGSLGYDKKISSEFAIRPVISIDGNSQVSGDGTKTNPYVIKIG